MRSHFQKSYECTSISILHSCRNDFELNFGRYAVMIVMFLVRKKSQHYISIWLVYILSKYFDGPFPFIHVN